MTAIQKAREAARKAYDEVSGNPTCDDPIGVAVDAALAALDAETPATPADVGELVAWRWKQIGRTDADAWSYQVGHPQMSDTLYVTEPVYSATALERVVRERDNAKEGMDIACGVSRMNLARAKDAEAKLAEALADRAAQAERMARMQEALRPIIRYVNARHRSPLKGIGDSVHMIHGGTEFEAELRFSDLETLARASQEGSEPS